MQTKLWAIWLFVVLLIEPAVMPLTSSAALDSLHKIQAEAAAAAATAATANTTNAAVGANYDDRGWRCTKAF